MRFSSAISILTLMTVMLVLSAVCTADETPVPEAKNNTGITWVKYDEGLRLAEKLDKMIFIDFYTDWCKFCHKMDRETFSNKEIIDYFDDNFVAVKINAESKIKLNLPDGQFNGRELARRFGVRGYPTYWFLKSDGSKINYISGYAPPTKFLPVLQYIGGKHFENMSFQEFVDKNSGEK
jgi:thioredoxin-related protein